jgi:hypothetical protein
MKSRLWPILRALCFVSAAGLFPGTAHAQVTTSQYNNARTGANLNETTLTPLNVNATQFGKLFSLPVDGDVYAQPLYVPNVEIPGKGTHNVVFAATEHDTVYAFDAEVRSSAPLWETSFLNPGAHVTSVTVANVACPFIAPVVGITSTPVIDLSSGTIYVLARTNESGRFVQRLHALAITTGAEKFGGPVEIRASVRGNKLLGIQGAVDFDPLRENPRAALLLVNGRIILSWASSCDVGPYHGWIMAYDAQTLAQVAVFNTSPDSDQSGIWGADTGPAADDEGNVFVSTGNGKFDAASANGRDFGDSVLRLSLTNKDFVVRDYFTPFNQEKLNDGDNDLGSGGPVLLPDQAGPHTHELVVSGKGGTIYVVDRGRMGKFHEGDDRHAVQTIQTGDSAFGAPAYWNGHLFFLISEEPLKDFAVKDGKLSQQPVAQAGLKFSDPGATPTVSANGSKNAIVWVIETKGWRSRDRQAVLHAYDGSNVAHELYNSEQESARDRAGPALRFTIPTVVDGKVYIGTKRELDVYGLLLSETKKK